jgi:REP element-mobilizing transposase RayT
MRRSIRLAGYDYTGPAAYLITIATHSRQPFFGAIVDGAMSLSSAGLIVQREWLRSADIRSELILDAFMVMPDHFHAIVSICPGADERTMGVGTQGVASLPRIDVPGKLHRPARSLGSLVARFKAACTIQIRARHPDDPRRRVWQRNYHESILRTPDAIERARWYVQENPRRWHEKATHDATKG